MTRKTNFENQNPVAWISVYGGKRFSVWSGGANKLWIVIFYIMVMMIMSKSQCKKCVKLLFSVKKSGSANLMAMPEL